MKKTLLTITAIVLTIMAFSQDMYRIESCKVIKNEVDLGWIQCNGAIKMDGTKYSIKVNESNFEGIVNPSSYEKKLDTTDTKIPMTIELWDAIDQDMNEIIVGFLNYEKQGRVFMLILKEDTYVFSLE